MKNKDEKTWEELEKEIKEEITAGDEITIYKRWDADDCEYYYVLTLSAQVWGMPAVVYENRSEYEEFDFDFNEDACGDWTPDDFVEDICNTIYD